MDSGQVLRRTAGDGRHRTPDEIHIQRGIKFHQEIRATECKGKQSVALATQGIYMEFINAVIGYRNTHDSANSFVPYENKPQRPSSENILLKF